MDAALRAIAALVDRVGRAPLGLTVVLNSGHTVRGMLVPNCDLQAIARPAVVESIRAQNGGGPIAGHRASEWDAQNTDLWRALDAGIEPDTLTFKDATIGSSPSVDERKVPIVRVDGAAVAAWWLLDEPVASDR